MTQLFTKKSPESKSEESSSNHKYGVRPFKLWQDIAEQQVHIEIVPLIDVIFCILIYFILAAVGFSRQQAITLNLPKASTGKAQMREMLVVSLDNRGQLYLEKQPVSQVQLYSAIKNYHSLNPTGLMVLHASQDVRYSQVVQVLDMLKEVGGDRVALATLAGKSSAPTQTVDPYSGFNPYYPTYPNGSMNQQPSQPSMTPLPSTPLNPPPPPPSN